MTHPHGRFDELLDEMKRLHAAKSADYAPDDPLDNFRLAQLAGIPTWVGILVRLTDKIARACAFAKKGRIAVRDEALRDTLLDAANYALLTWLAYEETTRSRKQPR